MTLLAIADSLLEKGKGYKLAKRSYRFMWIEVIQIAHIEVTMSGTIIIEGLRKSVTQEDIMADDWELL